MYDVPLVAVAPLTVDEQEAVLAIALNPEKTDAERVVALHRLRGAPAVSHVVVARRLVPILNEPLHWVGSEALLCLQALAPTLPIGVRSGFLVPSATSREMLIDDTMWWQCPDLGPVATAFELPHLPDTTTMPWMFVSPSLLVMDVDDVPLVLRPPGMRIVGADGQGPLAVEGPRLRLTLRHGDAMVERAPLKAGDDDGRVLVDGVPLPPSGITARRLTAGTVVTFGAHSLRFRRFHREVRPRQGQAMVNGARLNVGDAHVIPGLGHVVALNNDHVGVVVVGPEGVFAQRRSVADDPITLGPVTIEGVRGELAIRPVRAAADDEGHEDDEHDDDDDADDADDADDDDDDDDA